MTRVTKNFLGLQETNITYWDFDGASVSVTPTAQSEQLKEDLVQARLSATHILDIGWYPSFEPDGQFVVLVVQKDNWDSPVFRGEATTWSRLQAVIGAALISARPVAPT